MNDTYTVRRATMDDVKDIHALLMDSARKGLLLPRALIFLYGHVRNFLVIDDPRGGLAACCALAPVWEDLAEVCSLAVREDLRKQGLGRKIVTACRRLSQPASQKGLFPDLSGGFFRAHRLP